MIKALENLGGDDISEKSMGNQISLSSSSSSTSIDDPVQICPKPVTGVNMKTEKVPKWDESKGKLEKITQTSTQVIRLHKNKQRRNQQRTS